MHGKRRPVKIQTQLSLWVDRLVLDEHANCDVDMHLVIIIQGVFNPLCKLHGLVIAAHVVIDHGTQHLYTWLRIQVPPFSILQQDTSDSLEPYTAFCGEQARQWY